MNIGIVGINFIAIASLPKSVSNLSCCVCISEPVNTFYTVIFLQAKVGLSTHCKWLIHTFVHIFSVLFDFNKVLKCLASPFFPISVCRHKAKEMKRTTIEISFEQWCKVRWITIDINFTLTLIHFRVVVFVLFFCWKITKDDVIFWN